MNKVELALPARKRKSRRICLDAENCDGLAICHQSLGSIEEKMEKALIGARPTVAGLVPHFDTEQKI